MKRTRVTKLLTLIYVDFAKGFLNDLFGFGQAMESQAKAVNDARRIASEERKHADTIAHLKDQDSENKQMYLDRKADMQQKQEQFRKKSNKVNKQLLTTMKEESKKTHEQFLVHHSERIKKDRERLEAEKAKHAQDMNIIMAGYEQDLARIKENNRFQMQAQKAITRAQLQQINLQGAGVIKELNKEYAQKTLERQQKLHDKNELRHSMKTAYKTEQQDIVKAFAEDTLRKSIESEPSSSGDSSSSSSSSDDD